MPSVRVGLVDANKIISKLNERGEEHLKRKRRTRLLLIDHAWIAEPLSDPPFIDSLSHTLHLRLQNDYKKFENELQCVISGERKPRENEDFSHKVRVLGHYLNESTWVRQHGTMMSNIVHSDQNWINLVSTNASQERINGKSILDHLFSATNLAPNVDFKCLHADAGLEDPDSHLPPDMTDRMASEFAVEATLDRVLELARLKELKKGDVVVYPAAYTLFENVPQVPIIHSKEIAARIHNLTNNYKISFVIPAGNEPGMLGAANPGAPGWSFDGYFNAGASCGATIVDTGTGKKFAFENFGAHRCVDAYLNLYPNDLLKLSTHECKNHGLEEKKNTQADCYACRLRGTSAAAVAIACILATVQEARRLQNLKPLKPYEARAHLRQWKLPSRSIPRSICAPDVLGWLVGTGVFRVGPVAAHLRALASVSNKYEIDETEIAELFHI